MASLLRLPFTTWSARDALAEGSARYVHGRRQSWLMTLLVAGCLVGAVLADVAVVAGLVRQERAWVDAGGRLLVATNQRDGVPAAACEGLVRIRGVVAAGAVRATGDRVASTAMPGANLRLIEATPGIGSIIRSSALGSELVVADRAAARLGVTDRAHVLLTLASTGSAESPAGGTGAPGAGGSRTAMTTRTELPGHPVLARVVNGLGRLGEEFESGAILAISSRGQADACYVEPAPDARAAIRAALPALLQGNSGLGSTVVADRLIGGRFTTDYAAAYRERPIRWLPPAAGLMLGIVTLLLAWTRRSDDGLYALLGAGRRARALIHLAWWSRLAGTATGLAVAVIAAAAALRPEVFPADITISHGVRAVSMLILSFGVCAVLAAVLPVRSPLAQLRDR